MLAIKWHEYCTGNEYQLRELWPVRGPCTICFQQAGIESAGNSCTLLQDIQWLFVVSTSVTKELRRTSESLIYMSRIVSKLPIILLTILLGMAFQYGAVAGSVSAVNQWVHPDHPVDLADDNLLFAFDTVTIQDCNGSNADDSHTGQSCSLGICASCVPVISPQFLNTARYFFIRFSRQEGSQFVDTASSTLFRPPKA